MIKGNAIICRKISYSPIKIKTSYKSFAAAQSSRCRRVLLIYLNDVSLRTHEKRIKYERILRKEITKISIKGLS